MAVSTNPAGGVSLRGAPADIDNTKHVSKSAILFKLSQSMLNDLREASQGKDALHFVTGRVPVRLLASPDVRLHKLRLYVETTTGKPIVGP